MSVLMYRNCSRVKLDPEGIMLKQVSFATTSCHWAQSLVDPGMALLGTSTTVFGGATGMEPPGGLYMPRYQPESETSATNCTGTRLTQRKGSRTTIAGHSSNGHRISGSRL